MSKWHVLPGVTATVLSGAMWGGVLHAQDTAPQEQQQTESRQTEDADSTVPGTANPMPSTQQSEGTAADNTVPGATETRAPTTTTPGTANPVPATRRAEGTAADRSPPGETPVRGTAASQAPEQTTTRMAMVGDANQRRGSALIGMKVQDSQGQQLGSVKDIVIDPRSGQITHAIVNHSAGSGAQSMSAIPWKAAQGMMRSNAIVIDQSKLQSAPHFQGNQWPNLSQETWSDAADRYWRGSAKTGD